ncbi:MAG: tripartite tricarboxylate transporter TctB family protein [Sphaerochaeta sp.]|jgi:hypothetical protein|uniref:tripartite tricarboxylate transporter TctB family protein n=1 Tax=Sphaerochaeta sp. TaxID=1972642 RepID=UPI002FCB42F0
MDSKQKDFTISLALVALGFYTTIEGIRIYIRASKPPYNIENFSISPGLLPSVLGGLLLVLSFLLFFKSLQESSLQERMHTLMLWFRQAFTNTDIRMMVGGMLIMAVYAFLLIGKIPYALASALFLLALMVFLKAASIRKSLLVALVTVALVILLFQVVFKVSLP